MKMSEGTYLILADYFFLIIHNLLILFNLFGWIVKKWRRVHLACILLTFASWGILGIWYGFGYCPLTDWHWQVLRKLGEYDLPSSYVSYLLVRTLGIRLSPNLVDALTVGSALLALVASLWVNFRKKKPF